MIFARLIVSRSDSSGELQAVPSLVNAESIHLSEVDWTEIEADLVERGAVRGAIKVQNVVLPFGRHVVPQFVFIGEKAWRPTMLPIAIVQGDEGQFYWARVDFDVVFNRPARADILYTRHRRLAEYPDGSALYECLVTDADVLPQEAAIDHDGFRLKLFHHTSTECLPLIKKSGHIRASKWNYQGSAELDDRHFIYFTDVPRFENATDLMRVAMTDGGFTIGMQCDDPKLPPEIIVVPARDRAQISERIDCLVEPWLIESSPMLFHDPSLRGEGIARYWEFSHPNIYRIPVKPGTVCELSKSGVVNAECVPGWLDTKRMVAGSAFEPGGVRAVFDETPLEHLPINIGRDDPDPCPLNRFLRTPQPPVRR